MITIARRCGLALSTILVAAVTFTVAAALELPSELRHPPCVACQQPPAPTRARFSASDWKRLEDGEVVILDSQPSVGAGADDSIARESAAAVIVSRPVAEVWDVLADFEARPQFLPNVSESRVERVEESRVWISQHVSVLWMRIRYTLIMTLDPARGLITTALDRSAPHDIGDSQGSWEIVPDSESRALLVSRSTVETGMPLPDVIKNYVEKTSLPQMMNSLRNEVERRAKASASAR